MEERRTSEWALWDAPGPRERARDAIRVLESGIGFGEFPLDHVGFCEARADVERIVEELGLPHETFDSVVLGRELALDLRITRVRVHADRHLELFWLASGRMPTAALIARSHLAFRAPDRATLELVAERFATPVHPAQGGVHLAYLRPDLELVCSERSPIAPGGARGATSYSQ